MRFFGEQDVNEGMGWGGWHRRFSIIRFECAEIYTTLSAVIIFQGTKLIDHDTAKMKKYTEEIREE